MNKKNNTKLSIWLVIPAYNEEKTIYSVINGVRNIIPNILVVNDASIDKTREISEKLGVSLITNSLNIGYTKSIEKGLNYVFDHGAQFAITFDADGQHLAKDLPKFLEYIKKESPDIIFGNRSFKNRIIENLFGLLTKYKFGFSDAFCGLKSYKKEFFLKMSSKLENNYSIGTENIFIELFYSNPKIREVNLETVKRLDESRFAAGNLRGNLLELKAIFNVLKTILS